MQRVPAGERPYEHSALETGEHYSSSAAMRPFHVTDPECKVQNGLISGTRQPSGAYDDDDHAREDHPPKYGGKPRSSVRCERTAGLTYLLLSPRRSHPLGTTEFEW